MARWRAGDFVSVPLPGGSHGFARVLNKLIAFYQLESDIIPPIAEMARSPVAFITGVQVSAVKSGRWPIQGFLPVEPELLRDVKFFRRNPSGQGFLIYVSKATPPSAYEEYEASASDCVGLEPLLAWQPEHVEQRLQDHFRGRENIWIEREMAYLREYLRIEAQ